MCTIVKTIEQVGPAYRQRNSVASSSRQSKNNTTNSMISVTYLSRFTGGACGHEGN